MQNEQEKNRLRVLSVQQNIPLKISQPQIAQPQVTVTTPYIPPTPTVPEYQGIGARIQDIFNANSPQDIAKRQAVGQPAGYREQQLSLGNTRPSQNFLQAALREPLTYAGTTAALQQIGTVEAPKLFLAKLTGNKGAEQAARQRIEAITTGENKRYNAFGVPTAFGQKALGENTGIAQAAKRYTGAMLGTASYAFGGAELPKLATLGNASIKEVTKFVLKEGAAAAMQNVGGTLVEKPNASAQELTKSGLVGAAVGVPLAAAGAVITKGISKGISQAIETRAGRILATKIAESEDQNVIRQSIKNLFPDATKEELDTLSRRLADTKDPIEVANILKETAQKAESITPTPEVTKPVTQPVAQAVTPTAVPTITSTEVTKLLEGLPETTKTQFATDLSKATSQEEVQKITNQITNAKQAITQTVEQVAPNAPSPIQRQAEAAAKLVEQPPVRVETPAPVTRTVETPTPKAVATEVPQTYTVYRGSGDGKEIKTQFDTSILGNDKRYYAFDEATARRFGKNIEQTNITLNKPLVISSDEQWREITKAAGNHFANPTGLSKAELDQWIANIDASLKNQGYDGVIVRFAQDQDTKLIRDVFGSEQIVPFNAPIISQIPQSRFAITETPEQVRARLQARAAEAPIDQARIAPIYAADAMTRQTMEQFIQLPKTDFIERLAEQTGISAKWIRRALDKGNNPGWVYNAAMESVQGAEDVNKVFNNRVKSVKLGFIPKGQNLSPLINKEVTLKDGTIVRVLDTNANNSRLQVELPDGSVRTDITKKDLVLKGVVDSKELPVIKQEIPKATDVNALLSPTVVVDGNIVNTQTGEILQPMTDLVDQIYKAPSASNATINDFPNILSLRDNLNSRISQWAKTFSPEELQNFKEEMFMIDAEKLTPDEVTPKTKEMWDQLSGIFDALYARSKRVEGLDKPKMGYKQMFMPQQRMSYDTPQTVDFGYSTIDKANTTFGSAERRRGLLDVEEIKNPEQAYKDYVDQWTYDNYNHIAVANQPQYKDTYTNPVQYLQTQEKILDNLAAKSDVAVLNKTEMPVDTTPTIDLLTENFRKNALPEVKQTQIAPLTAKMPATSAIQETRQVLDNLGIYDNWGFKAHDQANQVGAQLFTDNVDEMLTMNKQQIEDRLKQLYIGRLPELPQTEDFLIRKRANAIWNQLNNSRKNVEMGVENVVAIDPYHFRNLERDLAAEKIFYNAERSDIKDPKVKKFVNGLIESVMTDNRKIETVFEKVMNELSSTLHSALLGLKPSASIQNLTETTRLYGVVDSDVAEQVVKEITTGKLNPKQILDLYGQDRSVINQLSNIPTNRRNFGPGDLLQRIRSASMFGFDTMEGIKDAMFLRGFELQGAKKGLKGRELGQFVAENYNKYAFKGGRYGGLQYANNPVGRLLFQFSQYPVKTIKFNAKFAKQVLTGTPAEKTAALKVLSKTYGANALAYAALYPIFGWGLQRAFGVDVPKFGPVVSLTMELYNIINDEQNRVNTAADEGKVEPFNWQNVIDRYGRKLIAYPVPGGDFLFNKLGVGEFLPDGSNPFSKNTTIATWQRGYEENYKGQARIEGPQNWYDYFTQAIGGQYNTSAARGYFGTTPYTFTIDLPGTAADIRFGQKDRMKPLNANEQRYFDTLTTKEEKNAFIEQKHKSTKLYQEIKKKLEEEFKGNLGNKLEVAIYGNRDLDPRQKRMEKNALLLNYPSLLAASNAFAAESPLPIKDPFLTLIPEHQQIVLRYMSMDEGDRQRRALLEQNKDWMPAFFKSREPFFNQFRNPNEQNTNVEDVGYNEPKLTDSIKNLREKYFQLDGWEARSQFLADNPSLDTYLKEKDTYDRNYNVINNYPNLDKYPEPDAQTQQYLDEYNAAGPKATEGRKAVERSAWIKANPEKWAKVQNYFTQSAMWSLQNELALTVFEGIDPTEKAFKNIANIAKGLGLTGYGFGAGKQTTASDLAYRTALSNLQLVDASNIGLKQLPIKKTNRARFKVSVPSSRRTQRIQLR